MPELSSLSEKTPITAEEFRQRVATEAYFIWGSEKYSRELHDWQSAQSLLIGELRRSPTREEIVSKAETLWLERKDRDADADWFQAIRIVSAAYRPR